MDSKTISPETQATVATMLEKAEDCFAIADAQHVAADLQHSHAEKLDALGISLTVSAAEIHGQALIDESRGRG